MDIVYRKAVEGDVEALSAFTDYWLAGGGGKDGIPGVGHDYFVRRGQHASYIKNYEVVVATLGSEIVGWGVRTKKGVLIHLLVAATFRSQGVGSRILEILKPAKIRSKVDQAAGDPIEYYRKRGFEKMSKERVGKHKNIDVLVPKEQVPRAIDKIREKFDERG